MTAIVIPFPSARFVDPCPLERARAEARQIIFESLRHRDPLSARIGRSLERCLARAEAASEEVDTVVRLHLEALAELEEHRSCDMEILSDIVEGVERLSCQHPAA